MPTPFRAIFWELPLGLIYSITVFVVEIIELHFPKKTAEKQQQQGGNNNRKANNSRDAYNSRDRQERWKHQYQEETLTSVGKAATAEALATSGALGMEQQRYEHINSRPYSSCNNSSRKDANSVRDGGKSRDIATRIRGTSILVRTTTAAGLPSTSENNSTAGTQGNQRHQ